MNLVWKTQTFDIMFTFKTKALNFERWKKVDTIHILVFNNATLKIYFSYIMKLIYEEKGIAFDFFSLCPNTAAYRIC